MLVVLLCPVHVQDKQTDELLNVLGMLKSIMSDRSATNVDSISNSFVLIEANSNSHDHSIFNRCKQLLW